MLCLQNKFVPTNVFLIKGKDGDCDTQNKNNCLNSAFVIIVVVSFRFCVNGVCSTNIHMNIFHFGLF